MEELHTIFNEIINQTIMISGFVLYMLLIIEYINVKSNGNWSNSFKKSSIKQISFSTLFCSIPGCIGIFSIVSLFTHNIIKFSSLLAGSIASLGDEAFVMISLIPNTYLKLIIILILLGIIIGFISKLIIKNDTFHKDNETHYQTHDENHCHCFDKKEFTNQIKKITFLRAFIITILMFIVLYQLFQGHEHAGHECNESHHMDIWENIFFIIGSIFSIFIVITVPEHFLNEHLWGHIIKKHFFKIFLWTFVALVGISVLTHFLDFNSWVENNKFPLLFLAILIGFIPISGPHLIFITLFANNLIPFSILLVNSFVQDGHGGIPLIAESKRSFIKLKLIKASIALIIGLLGYYMSW